MQYIIDRSAPIATGGTAKLYKCQDTIGIRGVCKIMPKSDATRRKFENEVACLKALSFSPKIVQLYDAVEADTEFALVMEWCRGGAVRDYTYKHGDIYSVNTVASILRGVLRGLVHVHQVGLVHMDVKPGNVLFTDTSENAEVKLADFGSAVWEDARKDVNVVAGTAWYMSPESLRSVITSKSDVWSVGVMTYQLLTGRMPFDDIGPDGPRVSHIWRKIMFEEPIWTGPRWESIPNEARDFVHLCLVKEPDARLSAADCLQHAWLTKTGCEDRFTGTALVMPPNCRARDECSYMHARTWELRATTHKI
jgi:calcium-dependent protein kinase